MANQDKKNENMNDKKVIEKISEEKNSRENRREQIKNFFGDENLSNTNATTNNNISNTNISSNPFSNNINLLTNNKATINYFVNSAMQGYNTAPNNSSFRTNFFLDREFIIKTFEVKMIFF